MVHSPRFWALFCTTEVPTESINRILLTCEESSKHSICVPDNVPNPWSLMSIQGQTHFDQPTATTYTGDTSHEFIGASFDKIGAFVHERFSLRSPKAQTDKFDITHDGFAAIDARTLKDQIFVFVRWELYDEQIDPASLDDRPEAFREVEGWTDIRVPLVMATELTNCLGPDLLIHDYKCQSMEEDSGVCIRDQADEREKAMTLQ